MAGKKTDYVWRPEYAPRCMGFALEEVQSFGFPCWDCGQDLWWHAWDCHHEDDEPCNCHRTAWKCVFCEPEEVVYGDWED